MKKSLEFKQFYRTVLVPELDKINSKRTIILLELLLVCTLFLGVIPTVIFFVFFNKPNISVFEYSMVVPFSPIWIYAFVKLMGLLIKNGPFYRDFKKNVIGKIISHINPNLHYDNRQYVSEKKFIQSRFFDHKIAIYTGDDHVAGVIDGVKVEFSELDVKLKTKAKEPVYFHGIFFVAETTENFPVNLVLEPKEANNPTQGTLLKIDNDRFNNYFKAYFLDEADVEEANKILTPDLIESIVRFRELMHNDLYLSIVDNRMHVGITHDKDLFEPQLWKTNKSYDYMHLHFMDMWFPINIINHIAIHKKFEKLEYTQN